MAFTKNSQVVHRPGPLKQSNKPHKPGRKGKRHDKSELGVKSLSQKKKHDLNRKERKNRLTQLRKTKRDEIISQKRGLGSFHSSPILCMILPLHDAVDADAFLFGLQNCDDEIVVNENKYGQCHLSFPKSKQRFTFFTPKKNDLHSIMDGVKVANTLILLHSDDFVDEYTELLLSVIVAHALPTTIHVVQGLDQKNPKKKSESRKNILKNMEVRFPNEKLHQADSKQDFQLILRQIGLQKQRPIGFRDARFHLLAEKVIFDHSNSEAGTLKVSGFVRGKTINVNSLVHIPGWGNFQLNQIDYENEPYPLVKRMSKVNSNKLADEEMSLDAVALCDKADPAQQESLQSEVIPDPMEGEQTWPTKEELDEVDLQPKKEYKKVVKGTSEYQSAWIIESSESDLSENESADCNQSISNENEDMDYETNDTESVADIKDENYDIGLDMDEEKQMLVKFKEERMNEMFPDELDTPLDIPARERFQRYRGLKNFNSSPWDPMENLPPDYAKIYRFENFKQTTKKALNVEKEGAMPGLYVTLHLKNVPQAIYDSIEENHPFVIFGLLPHEQKMSVVNVVIRKHALCTGPVKSKDTLIFHIGYQRFTCKPIFSEHKTGNKFKYERFLSRDTAVVASFYAPVTFPPASVVVFKQQQNGSHELVATGSLLDVNPNRVIVKRIVLSGHPSRILKKSAVVKYMFFNKDDIKWFKCIELRTKCGRRGHIRDSLGSHGHMKCTFDKQLQSQDVVLMSLYKRVFPKWNYDSYVNSPVDHSSDNKTEAIL